jgi:hypothetical protein
MMLSVLFLSGPAANAKRPPGDDDNQPSTTRRGRSSTGDDRSNSGGQRQRDSSPRREPTNSGAAQSTSKSGSLPSAARATPLLPPTGPVPSGERRSAWTPPSVNLPKATNSRAVTTKVGESPRIFADNIDSRRDDKPSTRPITSSVRDDDQSRKQADKLRKQALDSKLPPAALPVVTKRSEADSLRGKTGATLNSGVLPQSGMKADSSNALKLGMSAKDPKDSKDSSPPGQSERGGQPDGRKKGGDKGGTGAATGTGRVGTSKLGSPPDDRKDDHKKDIKDIPKKVFEQGPAGAAGAGRVGTSKLGSPPGDRKDDHKKEFKDIPKKVFEQGPAGAAGAGRVGTSKLGSPPGLKFPPGQTTTDKKIPAGVGGEIHDLSRMRFSEQLKAGHLDRLTTGEVAKKIKLSEQFRLAEQGDVARRLELHKQLGKVVNVTNVNNVTKVTNVHGVVGAASIYGHNLYHGPISPAFAHSCFSFSYWGPGFFAGQCWYPHWHPWVKWSWYHHCHPFWDPRPLWCRPVIYEPCPAWIWWGPPVWVPLPVVVCGTWVDVPPVAVVARHDLQLLAVRFVDPGHPEEKLGPRYRVWFRNNSHQPLAQPFNVMLFAANDNRLTADLPQAGVRVTSIEAGDIQSADIRLPMEVYGMGRDAAGNPAPFSALHVLVDANREVPETTRTNNGAHLARADVLPVDPAAFEVSPTEAAAGSEVMLAGEGFGPRPGQVVVHMGGLELEGEILGWYDLGVRLSLPKLPLAGATEAELIVVRGDGAAANPLKIRIAPPKPA